MSQYKQLVREHRQKDGSGSGVGRKRRKLRSRSEELELGAETSPVPKASESEDNSDDFEDVDLDELKEPRDSGGHSSGTDDEDEFEHVYDFLDEAPKEENDTINITLLQPPPEPTKRKVQFVTREERAHRLLIHQWYIVTMTCHGFFRNQWCNDKQLHLFLVRTVPSDTRRRLEALGAKRPGSVPSVQFIDILRELMTIFGSKFRVTKNGIVLKNWNELHIRQENTDKGVDAQRFRALCMAFQGSRDLGAQLFCALTRSLGLRSRLVFSLQPPDFTLVGQLPEIKLGEHQEVSRQKFVDNRQKFLRQAEKKTKKPEYKFHKSSYPVFWVEVYNRFSKKWVSIDPIVLRIVENCPMRRKTLFEPSLNDSAYQLLYAIAYDAAGGVKDVTRRYAHHYNSKIVKKRITSKSEVLADWYARVIRAINRRHKWTKLDILETKEFRDRDLSEGMPNSAAGFRDHPIYALESQLRQNQIIHPKDGSTKCGTFRFKVSAKSKKGSELMPVFKRSAVHTLYSAKAWYLRGRVLKIGQQPLKIKATTKRRNGYDEDDDDNDNDDTLNRLYAEFQTKMYIPPAIVDGKINKNAYGNIDVYVPTMIPEGGYLIDTRLWKYSMKVAVAAAKILEIDFAKAIVGFDFKGGVKKNYRRIPAVQEGGLLVALEYKEAMFAVMDQLREEEEEKKRKAIETSSLKNWKYFLTKLRISYRLNKHHGAFENNQLAINSELLATDHDIINPDSEGGRSVLKVSTSPEDYEPGGFMPYYGSDSDSTSSSSPFNDRLHEGPVVPLFEGETGSDTKSPNAKPKAEAVQNGNYGGFILEPSSPRSPTPMPIEVEDTDNDSFLEQIPVEDFIVVDGEMIYHPQSTLTHNPDDQGEFTIGLLNSRSAAKRQLILKPDAGELNYSSGLSQSDHEVIGVSDDGAENEFDFEYSDEE